MTGGCVGHSHDYDDSTSFSLHSHISHSSSYCLNEATAGSGVGVLRPYTERFHNSNNHRQHHDNHDHGHHHHSHDHSHDHGHDHDHSSTQASVPVTTSHDHSSTQVTTLCSDPEDPDDEEDMELLLHVAFTEAVNMNSFCVSGKLNTDGTPPTTAAPWKCKIFANRTDIDFETARELNGDVEIELLPPEHALEVEAEIAAAVASAGGGGGASEVPSSPGSIDYPLRGMKFNYCDNVTLYFGANYSVRALEDDDTAELLPTEITYVGFKGVGTNIQRKAVKTVYESMGMKKDHKVPEGEFGAKDSFM